MSIVLQAGLFGAGVAVGAFAAVQASRPSPPASTSARSDAGPSSSATALEARITNQLFSPLNPGARLLVAEAEQLGRREEGYSRLRSTRLWSIVSCLTKSHSLIHCCLPHPYAYRRTRLGYSTTHSVCGGLRQAKAASSMDSRAFDRSDSSPYSFFPSSASDRIRIVFVSTGRSSRQISGR